MLLQVVIEVASRGNIRSYITGTPCVFCVSLLFYSNFVCKTENHIGSIM